MDTQEIIEKYRRYTYGLGTYYKQPLPLVKGEGKWLTDSEDKRYLDFFGGIVTVSLGHCHPRVVAAIEKQAHTLQHVSTLFPTVPLVELAETLEKLFQGERPAKMFFTNSGTEAIEGAVKLVRKYTRRSRLVAFCGGYHGDTLGALSLCDSGAYRRPFEPLLGPVEFLPFGSVDDLARIDDGVAGVVIEPIQGEGGVRVPPDDFLPALRRRCDAVGALLVCDEVMTGLGRTGRWFACQHWDVSPDVLVLAKALGGGLPLGAFISRPAVMQTLAHDPPLAHVTTFGGHPLSCAAGLAALDLAARERLPERAARVGEAWRARLHGLVGAVLREVRGRGLLIGLEFASPELTRRFCRAAFARGLILNWTLHRDTVVRLAPPLVISDADSERALSAIEQAVAEVGH